MGRRRRSNTNGHYKEVEAATAAKRVEQARKYHPDPNPLGTISGDPRPCTYKGRPYPSTLEAEWAQVLTEEYKVEFQDHVNFDCHNNTRMTIYELDFIHPFIQLPDGSWCNATEVKGVIELESLVRNSAIRFSHPELEPRIITYADIRYIQRWGIHGDKKPKYTHSRKWTPEREREFLKLTTTLFFGYGIQHKRNVTLMSYDMGGKERPILLRPFTVDLLFIYPQKIRGISHEVDGVIVRLEPTPEDYLLIRSLKRYHGIDIALVTISYYKFWEKFGMFAENRQHRLRFGQRRKPRREGSEYLPADIQNSEVPEKPKNIK